MNSYQSSAFGNLLKLFRQRKKLSQQTLAKQIEVHRNTIGLWERGMERPETFSTLLHLATILDLDEEEKRALIEARFGTIALLSFSNIPFDRNPYFTGREHFLENLHGQLLSRECVAVTQAIVGLGGIGKTQLAVEYAYRYQDNYHTIFWILAETRETITHAFVEAARYLWLPERNANDEQRIVTAVKRWLSSHTKWLLIFDNLEDLSLIKQFVPAGAQGTMLITTQRQVTEPIAQAFPLTSMEEEESALFLLRRCKRLSPENNPLSVIEYHQAITISRILVGLPLALDQAGAYILETGSSLTEYLSLYKHEQAFLLTQRGSVPTEHPESVATTFALTFERIKQINPMALEILTVCAFLAADDIPEELFTTSATQLGSTFECIVANPHLFHTALKDLFAYSLIQRNREEKMLSMHRLVQIVLKSRIEDAAQQKWANRIVRAVNLAFPNPQELTLWPKCQRYMLQVEACWVLIDQWDIISVEAGYLLYQAGSYMTECARYVQAERLLKKSLSIREQAFGLEHVIVTQNLKDLAWLHYEQGRYSEAEPLLLGALKILEQQLGPDHLDVASSLNNLALLYRTQNLYDQAKPLFLRALTIQEQQLGPDHLDSARSLNNLALLYSDLGQYNEAEPLALRALTIRKLQLDSNHTNIANSLNTLAKIYILQDRYSEAELHLQRALVILEQHMGSEHPILAFCLHNLASVYEHQGQYDQAEQFHKQALAIRKKAFGQNHPDVANSLQLLAEFTLKKKQISIR